MGKWRGSRPGLLETVAVLFVAATAPAGAADADTCCADLEQRVAELDVLTARKGNRAVSVEISGSVNNAILSWDDGVEHKAYVVTTTTTAVAIDVACHRAAGSVSVLDRPTGLLFNIGGGLSKG